VRSGSAELRQNRGLLAACTVGVLFGTPFISYLLSPLARIFTAEFGWSVADVIRIMSFQAAGMMLGLPFAGMMADRIAPRLLILATMTMLAALAMCLPIAAQAGYAWFGGLFFLLGFLTAGLSGLYFTRIVGAVFHSARGFAFGVTLSGAGIAGFLAPLYAHATATGFSWQAVFLGAGLMILLVAMPIAWFGLAKAPHPRHPAGKTERADGISLASAMRDPRLYLMMTPPLAFGLVVTSLVIDIVPALLDRGVDAGTAALVASLYGIATILGRLGSGWLLDRFRPARVGAGLFAIGAIGTLTFQSGGAEGAILAAIAAGMINGAEVDIMSYMTVRYFGLGHYGRIFGTAYSVFMGAAVIGPFITADLMQRGGHDLLFLTASGLFVFSMIVLLILARIEGEPFDLAHRF